MDLKKQRGKIVINRFFLIEKPTEVMLRAIFSQFFPVATEPNNTVAFGNLTNFYGLSPQFREIEESEETPLYEMTIHEKSGEATVTFIEKF